MELPIYIIFSLLFVSTYQVFIINNNIMNLIILSNMIFVASFQKDGYTWDSSSTSSELWSTFETGTAPPYFDPSTIPDLQHVNMYISNTITDLNKILNDTELEQLKNELISLEETDSSDVADIMQIGTRQQDILNVISKDVSGNIKFCFDVVETMITPSHYNQTHQECLENLKVNISGIITHFEDKYHDIVSDLSALQVNYRGCNNDDLCKSEYVLKLYDLMYTSRLKLENELKTSKAYLNEAIVKIRTCSVEVSDYYTSIFDVVRQCIKNVATINHF